MSEPSRYNESLWQETLTGLWFLDVWECPPPGVQAHSMDMARTKFDSEPSMLDVDKARVCSINKLEKNMTQDFLGRILKPGDSVVYAYRRRSYLRLDKRTVQRIEDGKVYLVPQKSEAIDGKYVTHDVPEKRSTSAVNNTSLIKYIL